MRQAKDKGDGTLPNYARTTVHSISDIRAIADGAGSYFFDAASMRFFRSRVLEGVYAPDGHDAVEGNRFFFVTSERYDDDNPRHYAVRLLTLESVGDDQPVVDILTLGEHHDTPARAHKAAQHMCDTLTYLEG